MKTTSIVFNSDNDDYCDESQDESNDGCDSDGCDGLMVPYSLFKVL